MVAVAVVLAMMVPSSVLLPAASVSRPTAVGAGIFDGSGSSVSAGSVPSSAASAPPFVPQSSRWLNGAPSLPTLSHLPSNLQRFPWIQDLLHPHSGTPPLASVPNLQMLENPDHVVPGGLIYPSYGSAPAPLGIADYGLGTHPYAYNASFVNGRLTLTAPPNVTQPAASNVIGTSAAAERDGFVGSEYEFGVQLNTIGVNLTIPGTYNSTTNTWSGYVWAQNVVNWNDSGLHFLQDTWNFSLGSQTEWQYNSIYSGCGGNTGQANLILYVYGLVFQCSEGNVPLTAADYPVTLSLYNNFTTNPQGRSQLVYGYTITEAGVGRTISGIADTVVFNNTAPSYRNPTPPSNAPANSVDPFAVAPYVNATTGAQIDSEFDIVGGIEGANGVFSAINGSVQLLYANVTHDVFQNVPSAYNFGTDTGETSTGIADYWTPSHVLEIHQGPSMLYGLWNAEPQASVPSGDIHLAGAIDPSYGFVFVSNIPPVLNPWSSTESYNMSWMPTTANGTFNTYLPSLGGAWTNRYYVQAFADGYAEFNGTPVTGSNTTYNIVMVPSVGTLNAPLYMNGPGQASALTKALGGTGGSSYIFRNLVLDSNMSFARLNDWSFPDFVVFQSQGVNSVVVDNVTLGTDRGTIDQNSYLWDVPTKPGLFAAPVYVFLDNPYITSGINIFWGSDDQVLNQTVTYLCPPNMITGQQQCLGVNGRQVTLWGDTAARVENTQAIASYNVGVFVGGSVLTSVRSTDVASSGEGVTEVGSRQTTVTGMNVTSGSTGIVVQSSADGNYSWINVTGGLGIADGEDFGPHIPTIYDIPGTVDLTISELSVVYGGTGANITLSQGTTIRHVSLQDSHGIEIDMSSDLVGANVTANNSAAAYPVINSEEISFSSITLSDSVGGLIYSSRNVMIQGMDATNNSLGLLSEINSANVTLAGATATNLSGLAIYFDDMSSAGSISNAVVQSGPAPFVVLANDVSGLTISHVTMSGLSLDGLDLLDTVNCRIADIDLAGNGVAVAFTNSSELTITGVVAQQGGIGVMGGQTAQYGLGATISSVQASGGSLGVSLSDVANTTVTGVTAADASLGVSLSYSQLDSVSQVDATNLSVGVYAVHTDSISISHVVAADPAPGASPGLEYESYLGATGVLPVSAIVSSASSNLVLTNLTVTDYPAGVVDFGSGGGGATGIVVQGMTATNVSYGAYLQGTNHSMFSGLMIRQAYDAVWADAGLDDTFTASTFVNSSSFAIVFQNMSGSLVWDNSFLGNNGATSTYSAAHIQAAQYGGSGNLWYLCASPGSGSCLGNFWSDWHTFLPNGQLAPYQIFGPGGVFDYYPIQFPAGQSPVTFVATGLPFGLSWSVTFDGLTQSATGSTIVFGAAAGSYSFAVRSPSGYTVTPSSGTLTVGAQGVTVIVAFSTPAIYPITFSAGGLARGTVWSVAVNGLRQSTAGTAVTFYLPDGNYTYAFGAVAGYTLTGGNGTLVVNGQPLGLAAMYTSTTPVTYSVIFSEGGLAPGTVWSVTVDGIRQSTSGSSVSFSLPSGNYTYAFGEVSGYTVSGGNGTVTVRAQPTSVAATYLATPGPAPASASDLTTYFAIATGIAVVGLAVAVAALLLLRRPRHGTTAPMPPGPR
ncbi:MAG: thermopsin family protease [Thermoplasmata archaeon]